MKRVISFTVGLAVTVSSIILLGSCGPGINLLTCNLGSSLETVEELSLGAGVASRATSIAINGDGRIFVGGYMSSGGNDHAAVRVSDDSGATWSTKVLQLGDPSVSSVLRVVTDDSDGVFALATLDTSYRIRVISSDDGGDNWSTSAGFNYTGATYTQGGSMAWHNGAIYATAAALVGTDIRWIVIKSTDKGANWTVIDDFLPSGGNAYPPSGIAIRGDVMLVTGSFNTPTDYDGLLTRISEDGGVTWTTVEALETEPEGSGGLAAFLDPFGNAFVGGRTDDDGLDSKAVVRKGSGLTSWSTVDSHGVDPKSSAVTDLLADLQGQLIAIGQTYGGVSTTSQLWVRRGKDRGTEWQQLASKSFTGVTSANATGGAIAADGTLYVVGQHNDSGTISWFTYKVGCE